jgi:hypothetical protein
MSEHRIEELCLRLRVPARREHQLRYAAERFTRAVLERAAEWLEAQAPGRILLVRRLPLRWRLSEAALNDPAAIARCADDLVAVLERAAVGTAEPAPDDDLAVFEDEVQWRAAHLLARARGGAGAWFHAALEAEGDAVDALCTPSHRDLAAAVVARLAGDGTLVEVLAALPAATVVTLAQVLGVPVEETEGGLGGHREEQSPGLSLRHGSALPGESHTRTAETLADFAHGLPENLPREAAVLALHVEARRLLGLRASDTAVRAAVAQALAACGISVPRNRDVHAGPRPWTPTPAPGVPAESLVLLPGVGQAASASSGPAAALELETRFGGLFYLLNCALELNVGELLWKVCLPEGEVLAHAAAALLGPDGEGDPAPVLFGGVEPRHPFPAVASGQQEEVSVALLAALAAALPRRGLAELPEVVLGLAPSPAGRLLVAAATSSPFVLFALPAPSPRTVETGVRAFLSAWPAGAPPLRAPPAIAELDRAVRIRPAREAAIAPDLLLPAVPSLSAAALLAQMVGVVCQLFAARAPRLLSSVI